MTKLRFKCVEAASFRKAVDVKIPEERVEKYFGEKVFSRRKMMEYLPAEAYESLINAIDSKQPLPREVADDVARGMMKWASDNGATSRKAKRS